jgi:predicted adenine nucleotide alpha hydrolase (AANH) superfamily ATPase
LFLHSCCAPCSSYVLEYLSQYFEITVFFYNPNISIESEYQNRVNEIKRLIKEQQKEYRNSITFIEGEYDPKVFYDMAKGMEDLPERGQRCYHCYELRMKEAARMASESGADYFTTTLSISPHKNAVWINEIGERLESEYGIKHLPSDFKKKNGYKRSIELSEQFNLYRQDYCGCIYSKMERERQKREQNL